MNMRITNGQDHAEDICGHYLCGCPDCLISAPRPRVSNVLPFRREARS